MLTKPQFQHNILAANMHLIIKNNLGIHGCTILAACNLNRNCFQRDKSGVSEPNILVTQEPHSPTSPKACNKHHQFAVEKDTTRNEKKLRFEKCIIRDTAQYNAYSKLIKIVF